LLSEVLSDRFLVLELRHLVGGLVEWSLRVEVIQGNSQLEASHLLLELVVDVEFTINSVVLSDELEKRNSDVTKYDVVTLIENIIILDVVLALIIISLIEVISKDLPCSSELVELLSLRLNDVVSNFEDSSLVLEVLKDLGVHLKVHVEDFTKLRVE
jgi:hypothetical protein